MEEHGKMGHKIVSDVVDLLLLGHLSLLKDVLVAYLSPPGGVVVSVPGVVSPVSPLPDPSSPSPDPFPRRSLIFLIIGARSLASLAVNFCISGLFMTRFQMYQLPAFPMYYYLFNRCLDLPHEYCSQ